MDVVISLRPGKRAEFRHDRVADYFENVPRARVLSALHPDVATIALPEAQLKHLMPELEQIFLVKRLRGYSLL